jgi:predicted transcriptional regulator
MAKLLSHRALARIIAQHRRKAELTQAEVARRLAEPAWVMRYESGRRRIDVIEFLARRAHRLRSGQGTRSADAAATLAPSSRLSLVGWQRNAGKGDARRLIRRDR